DRRNGHRRAGHRRRSNRFSHRPRQPHGPVLRHRHHRQHDQGRRPRPDPARRGARPRDVRPRLRQHRVVPQLGHLHRRRGGDPGVPRLPHRAARGEVELPRGRLPAHPRRPAQQGGVRRVGARDHLSHVRARERQVVHGGIPLRRPPDGHADGLHRRPVDVLPRRPQHQRRREPPPADRADDRQDADAGRLVVPPHAGQAVRLPRQRPELHRQLPLHAVQDERAAVRGRRAPGQGPRRALHPARRPRAERLHQRGPLGGLDAGRPLLRGLRRRGCALRPAARRRQRGRAADAAPHRHHQRDPGVHRGRQGRQREADGLRPPGLQELRPPRPHHQEGRRGRLRGHRHQPAPGHRAGAGEDRPRGRVLHQAQALPQRRLLLRPDLRGVPVPARDVHRALRHRAHPRLAGAVAGAGAGQGAEDRPAQADLHRRPHARLRARLGALGL
ncbi:MAG: Citrate synthase (si), partial [uncultured Nocardioides sp.]